jgi:hypothetical protein
VVAAGTAIVEELEKLARKQVRGSYVRLDTAHREGKMYLTRASTDSYAESMFPHGARRGKGNVSLIAKGWVLQRRKTKAAESTPDKEREVD